MSEEKPRLGAGDVEIMLAGKPRVLRPTLAAAIAVSRMSGGILGAMHRVSQLDIDAMVAVTRAGLDLTERGAEGLDEKIYSSGLGYENGLAGRLTEFLQNLANGGKPRNAPEARRDDDENPQLGGAA